MKIETERLILRDLMKSDAKDIQENINNVKVSEFLLVVPHPYSIVDANSFIKNAIKAANKKPRKDYTFGIELKSKQLVIGVFGISNVSEFEGTCSMGYWLGEKYWQQGLMTEAFIAALNFVFNSLQLRRVNVYAFAENEASNNLIKKMGFKFEGVGRKSHRDKATGNIHDDNFYGLLKEEWLQNTNTI